MQMLCAAHHPSVFTMPEHVSVTDADGAEKQFMSVTPQRIRQPTEKVKDQPNRRSAIPQSVVN